MFEHFRAAALATAIGVAACGTTGPTATGLGVRTASTDGSVVTTAGPILVDNNGDVWQLTTGGQIAKDGTIDPATHDASVLVFHAGAITQLAATGWYAWNGSSWNATAQPLASLISSPGTTLNPGAFGDILNAAGAWTLASGGAYGGNLIDLGGQQAANGAAVSLVIDTNGAIFADNAQSDWYAWNGASWSAVGSPGISSLDGTSLAASATGNLFNGDGTWSFSASTASGGNAILLNGAQAGNGAAQLLVVANGGQMYAYNTQGNWYVWNGSGWDGASAPLPTGTSTTGGGGGGRNFLVGLYQGGQTESPTFTQTYGIVPDYSIDDSYMGPYGESSWLSPLDGYPVVVATSHFYAGPSGASSPWSAAANDPSYVAGWQANASNNLANYNIYALRLDWEWSGCWYNFSPYANPSCGGPGINVDYSYGSPGFDGPTFAAGFCNYVHAVKQILPNIKIAWDYPLASQGADSLSYYPGDDCVDIISSDMYFSPQYQGGDGNTSWSFYYSGATNNLQTMAAFAAAHGKPMAFWEVSDDYADGLALSQFGAWIQNNNVVAVSYWNSNSDGGRKLSSPDEWLGTDPNGNDIFGTTFSPGPDGLLPDQEAYKQHFTQPYSGAWWGSVFPVPAAAVSALQY